MSLPSTTISPNVMRSGWVKFTAFWGWKQVSWSVECIQMRNAKPINLTSLTELTTSLALIICATIWPLVPPIGCSAVCHLQLSMRLTRFWSMKHGHRWLSLARLKITLTFTPKSIRSFLTWNRRQKIHHYTKMMASSSKVITTLMRKASKCYSVTKVTKMLKIC